MLGCDTGAMKKKQSMTINQKRLLANDNLKHNTILNSIFTMHDINTI